MVKPDRSGSNRRLYSDDDIRLLNALQKAVESGHRIAQLARMERTTLHRLANILPEGNHLGLAPTDSGAAEDHVSVCIDAVESLDMDRLERALNNAATELSRLRLLENVIAPLMTRIGDRWSEGSLRILNEHMASTLVHSFLWDLLRGSGANGNRPAVVIATPSRQWCTLGALVAAVFAADIGWHPHFFGPNLPAEEISAAARQVGARVVALSITFGAEPVQLGRELKRLHLALDPSVRLLVGGRASDTVRTTIDDIGAMHVDTLSMFKSALEGAAVN